MVSTDPQAVAWNVELRSSGRVCVDVSRGRSVVYLVVGVAMTALAAGLLVSGGVSGIVCGALLALVAVPMLVLTVQQVLRVGSWRSPQVLVDAEGLTVRHGFMRIAWADLYGATAYTLKYNRWVALTMSPDSYDAWVRSRSPFMRLLARRPRRRRFGILQLPPNLAVDTRAFATWLNDEVRARQYAELERARQGLDAAVQHTVAEAERLAEEDRTQA
ncbi:hypothetical protein [Nocardioides conyzicola]|uniref:PH domain-containing protein n=1 Tax=Nocardioides conyzicola TaxID=1651781 RepID=A0ABP8WQY6_9ACTN